MCRNNKFDSIEENKPFPKNLKDKLEQNHETHKALADAVGCTRQSVSLYALGQRKPDYDLFQKIAEHYGVSMDWLAGTPGAVESVDPDVQMICKYTGLSEEAVNVLHGIKEKADKDDPTTVELRDFYEDQNHFEEWIIPAAALLYLNLLIPSPQFRRIAKYFRGLVNTYFMQSLSNDVKKEMDKNDPLRDYIEGIEDVKEYQLLLYQSIKQIELFYDQAIVDGTKKMDDAYWLFEQRFKNAFGYGRVMEGEEWERFNNDPRYNKTSGTSSPEE